MSRFSNFRNRIAQLAADDPDPDSLDERSFHTRASGVDVKRPNKTQMDDHWELFKKVPLVREPIRAFATEVVADGYTVEAGSQQAEEDLEDWLRQSAIVAGEIDKDFSEILKETIIQREVRGTSFVEIVQTEDGNIYGFKSIPARTVKQYTKPRQAVLLPPDWDGGGDFQKTDDGDVAAYIQFDDTLGFEDNDEIPLSRDDVIKLVRDNDAGKVWGTSRLEAVDDRVNSLLKKLDDNDKAIEMMAWKFWLVRLGTEEPWPDGKIDDFMNKHSEDDFAPGMKQAVQGDVEIDTIEGEVAEGLEEFLDFDVNWIISSMPYPKYGLGGFETDINQFVSRSQETRVRNQIREAREDIENEFEQVVKDKAEELGYSPDEVELNVGPDDPPPETDFTRPPASSEKEGPDGGDDPQNQDREQQFLPVDSVWTAGGEAEELADPRFVSTSDEVQHLERSAQSTLITLRDNLLARLETVINRSKGEPRPRRTRNVNNVVEAQMNRTLRKARLEREAMPVFETVQGDTLDTLSGLGVDTSAPSGISDRSDIRSYVTNYRRSVEDAAEQMASDIREQAITAMENGEDAQRVKGRIEDQYSSEKIGNRASIIARMQTQDAIESTKLKEFINDENVVGVEVLNSCGTGTTPLCSNLAGCGTNDPAKAFFEEGDIGRQFQEQVSEEQLFVGFNPLPSNPPWHFGCSSELAPIFAEEEEENEQAESN